MSKTKEEFKERLYELAKVGKLLKIKELLSNNRKRALSLFNPLFERCKTEVHYIGITTHHRNSRNERSIVEFM